MRYQDAIGLTEILDRLRDHAFSDRAQTLLAISKAECGTLIDFLDVVVDLGVSDSLPFEHLRDIPPVFAGVYVHHDGNIPADGRLIRFLLDEIDRRDVTIRYLDDQASFWKQEADEWRDLVIDPDYEGIV